MVQGLRAAVQEVESIVEKLRGSGARLVEANRSVADAVDKQAEATGLIGRNAEKGVRMMSEARSRVDDIEGSVAGLDASVNAFLDRVTREPGVEAETVTFGQTAAFEGPLNSVNRGVRDGIGQYLRAAQDAEPDPAGLEGYLMGRFVIEMLGGCGRNPTHAAFIQAFRARQEEIGIGDFRLRIGSRVE